MFSWYQEGPTSTTWQSSFTAGSSSYRRVVDGQTSIVERKNRMDGTSEDFVCDRLLIEPGKRAVLRYVVDRDRHIEGADLIVPKGTATIAHYWTDRPYNVYHWLSGAR